MQWPDRGQAQGPAARRGQRAGSGSGQPWKAGLSSTTASIIAPACSGFTSG